MCEWVRGLSAPGRLAAVSGVARYGLSGCLMADAGAVMSSQRNVYHDKYYILTRK